MLKIKFNVAYNGKNYHGFAKQKGNISTIQSCLEASLYELTGKKVEVLGSGRTDTGVHARKQCCMSILDTTIPIERMAKAMNARLPKDIIVSNVEAADKDFHPRFNVKVKTYKYQILNQDYNDPFVKDFVWFYPYKIDLEKMKQASQFFVGEHDFEGFCSAGSSVATTRRTIYKLDIYNKEETLVNIDVSGNGFLYNMVRIIVGTLIDVGQGKTLVSDIPHIIESKNRKLAGITAPAQGLTLYDVKY
ncbi:MAG: tRNA pseudouridine(38-40) synthase TruA [Candidatus Epulonipiscium fishelsonii]|nr:MAG: tRNA pseudouridine(38-40) synthase TruA [Epulopiscium sp. AS2M-Bin002]